MENQIESLIQQAKTYKLMFDLTGNVNYKEQLIITYKALKQLTSLFKELTDDKTWGIAKAA